MQDGHKVRVCISVVYLLPDEIKNLVSTFGVYMYLEEKERNNSPVNHFILNILRTQICVFFFFFLLTDSKRFDKASSSSFRSISK